MSEGMVEKIARAIGEEAIDAEPKWRLDWPHLLDDDSNAGVDLRVLARAAIEAMREPPKAVLDMAAMTEIKSAWVADFGNGRDEPVTFPIVFALHEIGWKDANVAVASIWGEMIDAALSESMKGE